MSRLAEVVVIGNPDGRRVALFQAALAGLGYSPAQVVAWSDLLAGRVALTDVVRRASVVRIESPGKDFPVERALLAAGAELPDGDGFDRLSRSAVEQLTFERGRILAPRQWYLGFCRTLEILDRQLAECREHRLMNRPADIALMFDKGRCQGILAGRGIVVPRSLGEVRSYEELVAEMRQARCYRVFVKLAHGSSASGVVAYQTDGRRHQAVTTVEMVWQDGEMRLYNSRRMCVYRDEREVADLIDALCRHRVHVEEWLPKAGIAERTLDLRVVVIAGRARHVVVRLSRSPMTNLHLLNARGDWEAVRERMGPEAWEAARETCERAMRCVGGSLYAGIDLLLAPDYRRHAVLELNAFGDLLPGVLWEGMDTYAAEVTALLGDPASGLEPVRALA